MKKIAAAFLLLLTLCWPARAGNLVPILISNGVGTIPCNGQMHIGWDAPLWGNTVVGSYLFGNLITAPGSGADIVLIYTNAASGYPPPYSGGPSSQYGTIGDLHIFSQPAGHTGGRQGVAERWFPAGDGILIPSGNSVQLAVICWGGGTLEVYAQIWVK